MPWATSIQRLVKTVPRRGYIFDAEVTGGHPVVPEPDSSEIQSTVRSIPPTRGSRAFAAGAACAAVLLAALAWVPYRDRAGTGSRLIRSRRLTALALILAAGSALLGAQAVPGQSNSSCRHAGGTWLDTLNNAGGTSGRISNAGILNGTTETVYNPAFVFSVDPNVVSYIAETTVTTNLGELKTSNVYIYNFITGLGTAMGRINPAASSGRFAGATGVLYFNTKTIGVLPNQSYESTITGEVCFADE